MFMSLAFYLDYLRYSRTSDKILVTPRFFLENSPAATTTLMSLGLALAIAFAASLSAAMIGRSSGDNWKEFDI